MRSGAFAHDNGMDTILTERGVYHVFFAPNGALTPDAHDRFRAAAADGAPLIYADEEAHLPDGRKKCVKKPDWSPDTLRSCNYIGSPFAAQRALCETVGMPCANTAEERYAFVLRLAERAGTAKHIPSVLYRGAAEQPCSDPQVLRRAVRRDYPAALVMPGQVDGSFCVRYPIPYKTRVSCIVAGAGGVDAVRATLEAIVCRATSPELELIVCDGGGIDERKEAYYAALTDYGAAHIIRAYREPNIPTLLNRAAENASGEALLFLPAGAEVALHDTIERMLEYALLPHIAAVGGVTVRGGKARPGIIHNVRFFEGPMMTRSDYFASQGGFDTTFARVGYVRAFTQLSSDLGHGCVVTPYAAFSEKRRPEQLAPTAVNAQRMKDLQFAHRNERS